jgi:4-cresol dehydrogenase (hydroxylating) flavoprotein subunit
MDVLNAWKAVVGKDNVLTNNATLTEIQQATFATKQSVLAVIKPKNSQEVQSCIKIANQYKTAVYPVSGGKNWGLGSRVPVATNCALLDLSRLNQILEYNEKLAYITVEPGVTFRQICNFLKQQKSKFCVSAIGGSPDASAIGNTLERGDGTGPAPYGERLDHVCGLEVILPTGELINTGFGRFKNAQTAHVSRWGVGPYCAGLFTQSNLGIVTKMTMWLMPIPEYLQGFKCVVENTQKLRHLLDAVQDLMLQGIVKGNSFVIWNCYKALSSEGRYPWKVMDGKVPLSLSELKGVEPWIGIGRFHSANQDVGRAEREVTQSKLEKVVDELNFSVHESEILSEPPSMEHIKCTYWRKKQSIPDYMNPDRDNCGLIWLCCALPFDSQQIVSIIPKLESKVRAYKFEPDIGIRCVSGRIVYLLLAIIYDRDMVGEDEQAMQCYQETLQLMLDSGYIPHRLGIQSMKDLPASHDDYGYFIQTLKQNLDPNDILAPGRYDFRNEWSNYSTINGLQNNSQTYSLVD